MREIEFKAKCLRNNQQWVEGSYVAHLGTIQDEYQDFDIDLNTLCQYIDQRDANKKKIFEGDIVIINGDFEQVGVIKWDKDTSMFVICVENIIYTFDEFYGYELEVIGNIYDNPELIGGAK